MSAKSQNPEMGVGSPQAGVIGGVNCKTLALGIRLESPARTVCALNPWSVSLVLDYLAFMNLPDNFIDWSRQCCTLINNLLKAGFEMNTLYFQFPTQQKTVWRIHLLLFMSLQPIKRPKEN